MSSSSPLSVAYVGLVPAGAALPGDTDGDFFPINDLPALAPRQRAMIDAAITHVQHRVGQAPVAFRLLPSTFTLSELQELNMHGAERPLFKMENDPRITRVGHVLRKTSLDELPQLLNVLKGQMSLIGPRPALPLEVEMYDYVARRRLAVKPGITGLWQVSGRSDLSWAESVRLDVKYVDNWSLMLDLSILCRTVTAVLNHRGAY